MGIGTTTLKALAVATAMTAVPMAASAVTIGPDSNLTDGGTYDINAGPYFYNVSFVDSDTAGSFSFTFDNLTSATQTVAVSIGTVLQSTLDFLGGVSVAWLGGDSITIPEGDTDTFEIYTTIGVGGSDTLVVTYGDPEDVFTGGRGNIDLTVAAVPVPAGGLLLLTALGGLGLARRKRKTA